MTTNNANNFANPIGVANGGIGSSSLTAYTPICGGTTSTGAVQSVASIGNAGNTLYSNGASALPSFSPYGTLVFLNAQTASNSANISFTSQITSTYSTYLVVMSTILAQTTGGGVLTMATSTNGGSSYASSGYQSGLTIWTYNSATTSNINRAAQIDVFSTMPTSGIGTNGFMWLYNVQNGANFVCTGKLFSINNAGTTRMTTLGATIGSANVNAIQFSITTANIASGKFSLYGLIEN